MVDAGSDFRASRGDRVDEVEVLVGRDARSALRARGVIGGVLIEAGALGGGFGVSEAWRGVRVWVVGGGGERWRAGTGDAARAKKA